MKPTSSLIRQIGFALLPSILLFGPSTLPAQGPLTPPPGAPAPSMKSLDQIEPRIAIDATSTPGDATSTFRITQPGSYFFTGNITGVAAKNGITIAVGGVTLDLNGFSLTGVAGSLHGVHAPGIARRVSIRNGTITGWDGAAVNGASLIISEYENLRVSNNDGDGLVIGSASTMNDCVAQDMGGSGLRAATGSVLTGCTSLSNVTGITAANSTVLNCLVRQNTGVGISLTGISAVAESIVADNVGTGIVTEGGTRIDRTTSSNNGGHGITMVGGSVTGCTANSNTGDGIRTGLGASTIKDCVAEGNARGIVVGSGAVITGCSVKSNSGEGIVTGSKSNIVGCSAYQNGSSGIATNTSTVSDSMAGDNLGTGISALGASSVTHCTSFSNGLQGIVGFMVKGCNATANNSHGIEISSNASASGGFAIENTSIHNGFSGDGAGIFVVSSHNRIEANNAHENDRGIDVDGHSNLIIRNSATFNSTNYDVADGNRYGPVVFSNGGAAFSGNSAPDRTNTTHPWANFAY